jgi:hypothetical protein
MVILIGIFREASASFPDQHGMPLYVLCIQVIRNENEKATAKAGGQF